MYPVKDVIPGTPDTNIGAPPGQEDEIQPLPAAIGPHHSGMPMIVSRWRPTPAERAAIAAGGDVFLHVFSRVMVPVLVTTDQPIWAGDGKRLVILTPDHPDYAGLTAPPGIGG